MRKNVLKQYCGYLTTNQVAEGMSAAAANASRLAADARLLFEAERYPSAASLAVLSLEESGKVSILRQLVSAQSDLDVKDVWSRYRRHTEKNYLALLPDLVAEGARTLREFARCFLGESISERIAFDAVKQLGFYTDCCGDAHWSIPTEVITKDLASLLLSLATALSSNECGATAKEMELWAGYMHAGLNRENLLKWAAAMVNAGLKPPDYVEKMRRFTEGL
jgi:AbiV family abortive infection protein